MTDAALAIGDLATRTGTKVSTIRYYEDLGLLPVAARTQGNHRVYTPKHSDRLAFIRHARDLGFSLDVVRTLLDLTDTPDASCEDAHRIAKSHLADVEAKLAMLESLRAELRRMVRSCARGRVAECRVIEVLADHSHAHCKDDHRPRSATKRR